MGWARARQAPRACCWVSTGVLHFYVPPLALESLGLGLGPETTQQKARVQMCAWIMDQEAAVGENLIGGLQNSAFR